MAGPFPGQPHPSPMPQRVPARSCILALSSKLSCTVSTRLSGFRRLRLVDFLAGAFRALDLRAVFLPLALRAGDFRLVFVFALVRLFALVLRAFAILSSASLCPQDYGFLLRLQSGGPG